MIKRIFYGWWIVLACSLLGLYVGGIVFFGFTAFFEPIREECGWSYTQISFAASLRGLEMGIFSPLVGLLVDRFGPRKLMVWGTITVGFGLILLSFTQSLAMFYAAFLLLAFGAGGCTAVVTMTAVANWFRRKVGLALGLMGSGVGAGGLMVMLIVGLIDLYQWRGTLIILGVGMWALGIPLSLIVRDRPEHYGYRPDGEVSSPHIEGHQTHDKGVEIGLRQALTMRSFLYLTIVELVRMMALMAVFTHVMPYLASVGMPRPTAGLVAGAIPLIGIIGRFGLGWLGDVFDKRHVLAVAMGLISLGLLAFSYVQVRWAIVPFLLLFSIGHGGSMVVRGSIVREYFGRDSFGKMIGVLMGAAAFGGIIGPTLAGWAFDTVGSYHPVWLLLCGLNGLTTVLILRIKRSPL
jgi:OFA family oxalate/formate antiporter-like MFS transporter